MENDIERIKAVLSCAAAGMDIRQSMDHLGVSRSALFMWRHLAVRRMSARNITHAVAEALRGGVIR